MLNALAACILSILLTVAVLQSDLTPYRIVTKAELEALANKAAATAAAPAPRPGEWMYDPTRKTPLDRPASRTGGVYSLPIYR